MADAAEEVAGLATGTIRLKWPNDLVVVVAGPGAALRATDRAAPAAPAAPAAIARLAAPAAIARLAAPAAIARLAAPAAIARLAAPIEIRKLAGILGETDGLGTGDPRAVIGIGINADWAAPDFPAELAGSMTSLREASSGRPIDRELLLDAFLSRLELRLAALRGGRFDVAGWAERQVTTGRLVQLEGPNGSSELVRSTGVDGASGALFVEVAGADGTAERAVYAGEITHLRLAPAGTPAVPTTTLATSSTRAPAGTV
jgi:biotin-(acetyl-CoA carboxylase) ligase